VTSVGRLVLFLYGLFIAGLGLFLCWKQIEQAFTAFGSERLVEGAILLTFVLILGVASVAYFMLMLVQGVLRE
jgi:hypothetical protein